MMTGFAREDILIYKIGLSRKVNILHFFLHLLPDELLGVCSEFICLVTAKEDWYLLLDNVRIGQNVVEVPKTIRNHGNASFF